MPKTNFITDETIEEEVKKPAPKKTQEKKHFEQTDGIICRSVVEGGLHMEGTKTQIDYSWSDYGDVSEVEYRDLVAAVRSKSKFVFNPWFIIEDKDFLAEFPQVQKFYDESYSLKDLKKILQMSVSEMERAIESLPAGAKESLKSIAAKQVATGMLDSISKVKALDRIYGTNLGLIGEMSETE